MWCVIIAKAKKHGCPKLIRKKLVNKMGKKYSKKIKANVEVIFQTFSPILGHMIKI